MARPVKAYPFDGLKEGTSVRVSSPDHRAVGRAAYRRRQADGSPMYRVQIGEGWVVIHKPPALQTQQSPC